ncbi:MAG TPA: hypothetical protein VH138_17005 [Vicinamibacterales bacterium]|jgi:hypothetical protein|nr:hypothetical protein [Vicinamibacterales bacterium]
MKVWSSDHPFGERDAARFVGYSIAFLRMARQKNRGPAFIRIGRSIRYDE